ncbi:MAG: SpoIIE family protein phosphatase [Flavobacteriales bacterium]|nr:SpoIIE family protein phosphatase [Flavobacteriales bacterium]
MSALRFLLLPIYLLTIGLAQGQSTSDSLEALIMTKAGEERLTAIGDQASSVTLPEDLEYWGQRLVDEAKTQDNSYWQAGGTHYLARSVYLKGDILGSLKFRRKAVALYKSVDRQDKMARQYLSMGNAHTDLGNYDSAFHYFELTKKFAIASKDSVALTGAFLNISTIYHERGEKVKELEFLLKSIDLAKSRKDSSQLGVMTFNLAVFYAEQEEDTKSKQNLREAREIYLLRDDLYGLASVFSLQAQFAFYEDEIDSALYFLDLAAQNYELLGERSRAASMRMNEGETLAKAERWNEAKAKLNSALDVFREIGEKRFLSITLHTLGQVEFELGNSDRAESFMQEAIHLSKEIGTIEDYTHWHRDLAELFFHVGKSKEAYLSLQQHSDEKDSLYSRSRQDAIQEMEARFQNEQKQLEIENLEQEQLLSQAKLGEERSRRLLLIGGLVAAMILLVLMGYGFALKRRDNRVIQAQKEQVESQRDQIDLQRMLVEEKNREVMDSIIYAKRIQTAILPPDRIIEEHLPESFVFYQPKDVVAGDFYWMEAIDDVVYFAAADCTGHGVPGAMVSVICVNGLNRSVREFGLRDPGQILDQTRELVIKEFEKSEEDVKDGMDISLCALNTKTKALEWAGAHNPLWIIRAGSEEIEEIKADKQPIGKFEMAKPFTTHRVKLNENDTIYVFSDGYPDQFGGTNGKKYKSGNFKKTLLRICPEPIAEQKPILANEFEKWRGDNEQVDDVCVIGVRV